MRSLLAVLVVAAPLAAADPLPHATHAAGWIGHFPTQPEVDVKELAVSPGRSVPVTSHRATDPKSGAVFTVTVAEYPPAFAEVPADVLLDGVRDGLKGKDGRVKRDDHVRDGADRLPGRALRIEAGKNLLRARLYLHGSRLIQVTVGGPGKGFPDKAADAFFERFEPAR